MGLGNQLNNIESGFATVAAFPQFKDRPIVIGESDPDGCAACTGPQLNYRNSTLYASYTAAAVAHTLMIADKRGINLLGALTWAFEMEGKLYFAGYRVLSTNGIDLPVLNVFRMLAKMEGNWVAVQSSSAQRLSAVEKSGIRGGPDVSSIATVSGNRMAVLTWNYHDDDLPASAANVDMTLSGFPAGAAIAHVTEYRIDPTHSNAYTAWIAMGSPQPPTKEQYSELQKAGRLQTMGEAQALPIDHGQVSLEIHLPRQGVSLLVLTFN
jgi:xylan 1,4-beta-xylosidase